MDTEDINRLLREHRAALVAQVALERALEYECRARQASERAVSNLRLLLDNARRPCKCEQTHKKTPHHPC